MTTAAGIGWGARVVVHDGEDPGSFFELEEVQLITPPSAAVDQLDATHARMDDRVRTFFGGLADPGEVVVEMSWNPDSDTDAFVRDWRAIGARLWVWADAPEGPSIGFSAFVTGYDLATPISDRKTARLTCKAAGKTIQVARRLDFSRAICSGLLAVI